MLGGIFQGSNDPNFVNGVADLYTISVTPTVGGFTTVPITSTTAYKYVRYLAPASSYGNVAELEFDGTLTGNQPPNPGNPSVTTSSPANGAIDVDPTGFVSCAPQPSQRGCRFKSKHIDCNYCLSDADI